MDDWSKRRICCIGTVNIDRVYAVARAVRDGEAVTCRKHFSSWGGKGLNQMVALRRAGIEPTLFTKVGRRDHQSLIALLEQNQMDTIGVIPIDGETNYGLIQVNEAGQTAIIGVPSEDIDLSHSEMDQILQGFSAGDVLLVQNEIAEIPYLLQAAKGRGLTVVLNPSPLCAEMRRWPFDCVDILILNQTEGEALSGETTPEAILAALAQKNPGGQIVLTLGERGCFYRGDGQALYQQAIPAEAVDTTAAGDTFTGFFLASYLRTGDARSALATAAKAASIVVARMGAAESIPLRSEVEPM